MIFLSSQPYYYPDFSLIWNKDTTCDLEGLKCIGGKTSM